MKLIFFIITILSQSIDYGLDMNVEFNTSHYYNTDNTCISITEYVLTNNSDEEYYTWFSSNPSSDIEKEIRRYFCSFHGDLNLISLIDDNVTLESFIPTLGKTFVKMIKPGESFTYTVVQFNKEIAFRENIIYAPGHMVEQVVSAAIKTSPILYEENSIVITSSANSTKKLSNFLKRLKIF